MCVGITRAQNTLAPGAPGKDAAWTSVNEDGIGTSNALHSKVWFTLQGGALTEIYYPTVETANIRILQFIVVSETDKRVEGQDLAARWRDRSSAVQHRGACFKSP